MTPDELWEELDRNYFVPILDKLDRKIEEAESALPLINPADSIDRKAIGPVMFNSVAERKKRPKGPGGPIPKATKTPNHMLSTNSRLQVWNGERSCHIADFFASDDWVTQHQTTTSSEPLSIDLEFPKLKEGHELKPWQEIGAAKMAKSCNLHLGGLIIGDETGLGKSLMALVAALHQRNQMLPECGPVCVVTRPGCVVQWWDEIDRHFSEETRPKAIIVDRAAIPFMKIMEYDVIIVSNGFLQQRFKDIQTQRLWCETVKTSGIQEAEELFPKYHHKKIHMPLHSPQYRWLNRLFPVLIVDEAHDARNPESIYHQAIRELPYHNAFLLTATPIFNTWRDIGGILLFLPGSPFKSVDDFRRVFAIPPSLQGQVGRKGPEGPFIRLLQHLVSGAVLARPNSVSDLPPVHKHYIMVKDSMPRVVDLMILSQTSTATDLIWGNAAFASYHPGREGQLQRGIRLLRAAQQISNHQMLLNPHETYEKGKKERAEIYSNFEKITKKHIKKWQAQNSEHTLDSTHVDGLTAVQYESFKRWFIPHAYFPELSQETFKRISHSRSRKIPGGSKVINLRSKQPPTDEDLEMAQQAMIDDEGFNYAQDKEDPDFDPDNPNHDVNDEGYLTDTSDTDGHHAKRKRQSNPKAKQVWEDTMKRMSIEELSSPKIEAITRLLAEIQSSYPSEKIIVTSASVQFLDILCEYLSRQAPELTMVQFDGRITSMEKRTEIANQFNSEDSGINLLLLSAACGGTGLNLHGGSHVIITERFWTPGLEKQVIGRASRMPQKREVHVYFVHIESAVDKLVGDLLNKKKDVEHPLERAFRRADDMQYVEGSLPTHKELGEKMTGYDTANKELLQARKEAKKEAKKTAKNAEEDAESSKKKADVMEDESALVDAQLRREMRDFCGLSDDDDEDEDREEYDGEEGDEDDEDDEEDEFSKEGEKQLKYWPRL
ncbi:hypothetical protein FPOA_01120 [Fusarium poae]|uniref:Helicase ATP-binding domain-containing protein n=1 Tax=Fusarium poae TaxID=36050 RepID=A0A1B8B364_FUSPO|nr:hypothetical protein FPOA_01120 [Fusarium poae]